MNKKLISIILMLSFVLQLGFVVNAEEEYEPYTESKSFLQTLNVVEDNVVFSNSISRGEAAVYIVKMLNDEASLTEYRGIFADVPNGSECALAVEKLADYGIVQGYDDYTYRPDAFLTYNEAIEVFLNVMGFGSIKGKLFNSAELAQQYDLLENVQGRSGFINIGDFIVMMYNVLMGQVLDVDLSAGRTEYVMSDATLLYKKYNILYSDGVVVKNGMTYLWSAQGVNPNTIELQTNNGEKLTINIKNSPEANDLLGNNIRVYYTAADMENDNTYVYHEIRKNNNELAFNLNALDLDKSSIGDKKIYYFPENQSKAVNKKLSNDCAIIYNNAVYKNSSFDFKALENKSGHVSLIDNDNDGQYDVLKIKAYDSYIVGNMSEKYDVMYDKYDSQKVLSTSVDAYDSIWVYDAEGKTIGLADIASDAILSVAISDTYADNDVLEIRVSSRVENGKITDYKDNAFAPAITLDGINTYYLSDRAAQETISINRDIIAYFDVFGNIVYISSDYGRDMQYGLVTKIWTDEMNENLYINYMTVSKELKQTKAAKSVAIDGVPYKNKMADARAALNAVRTTIGTTELSNGVFVFRYKVNEAGEITVIDTQKSGTGGQYDSLEHMGGGRFGVNSGYVLGWTIPFKSDTMVMSVSARNYQNPNDFENPRNISISTGSTILKTGSHYNVSAYKTDTESLYADFVLRTAGSALEYGSALFVVDDITQVYDDDIKETLYQLNGYSNGVSTSVKLSNDAESTQTLKNLKRGDVIRYTADAANCLMGYEPIVISNQDGTLTFSNVTGGSLSPENIPSVTMLNGFVYERSENLIKTNQFAFGAASADVADVSWNDATFRFTNILSSVQVVVVDFKDKTVKTGTVNDILDYKNFKENCSRVLMRFRSGTLNEIIVFNN